MKNKPAETSELAQLGVAAAAADALADEPAAPAGSPAQAMPAAPDPAMEWARFPALFGSIVGSVMPELAPVYSDAACRNWGEAMVPLAAKYGWSPSEFMKWLDPWVGLGLATWPLAVPTVQAIRARRSPGAPGGEVKPEPSNVVKMPIVGADPDLRDPTQTNRPPRPA